MSSSSIVGLIFFGLKVFDVMWKKNYFGCQ